MELVFLLALLFVVVWLNRGLLGFGGSGCNWMASDADTSDGQRKWMCGRCGAVEVTDGKTPPTICHAKKGR